jgi:7,8-dihydropterin-6-yl-methyl-4-(beta-D-ribofuranosyl)aminobenzene 5'-phosphate synthase
MDSLSKEGKETPMETIDITAADSVNITVVIDNYYDSVRRDASIGKTFRTIPGQTIYAEHGLSCVIETAVEGVLGMFMFDYGVSGQALQNNLKVLDIDVSRLQAFSLSHGHFDHWGGLIPFLKTYSGHIKAGTPLYAGEEAFAHRFSVRPSGDDLHDLGSLDRDKIESSGKVTVIDVREPVEIITGAWFTGDIARTTSYEKVPPALLVMHGENIEQDDFRGEQAVICNVRGKGLVVISGCAHAGIINTVRHAQKLTGIDKVHAVIGGFHLVNADTEIIWQTIADMQGIAPEYVIPMHCTGFEAVTAFRDAMPEQFVLNTAGTRYSFGS